MYHAYPVPAVAVATLRLLPHTVMRAVLCLALGGARQVQIPVRAAL
jgi:hypothetical protein